MAVTVLYSQAVDSPTSSTSKSECSKCCCLKANWFGMFEAYFDESGTHAGASIMCVAGYVIESDQCGLFQAAWDEILLRYDLPYFHMAECAHRKGAFARLPKQDCDSVARSLIDLIKSHVNIGVIVSLREDDFYRFVPADKRSNPYVFAVQACLSGVVAWATRYGIDDEIAYFLEAGHASQRETNVYLSHLASYRGVREGLRYASHTFVSSDMSKRLCGLSAADMLAWEWSKDYKSVHEDEGRSQRRSLAVLLQSTHIAMHCDQEFLREYGAMTERVFRGEPANASDQLRRYRETGGFQRMPRL